MTTGAADNCGSVAVVDDDDWLMFVGGANEMRQPVNQQDQ